MFYNLSFTHFSTEYKRGNFPYYFPCDVNGISVFNAAVTAVGLCAMTLSSPCTRKQDRNKYNQYHVSTNTDPYFISLIFTSSQPLI